MNGKEVAAKDERRQPIALERRSAQQIERDNQRQKSFEARRTASQPQLAYDDEVKTEIQDHRPQPQAASSTPSRRGSHGNIMEANRKQEQEKDSDDGGFLKRHGSKERRLDGGQKLDDGSSNGDSKVTDALQGAPRKKLEGEIGKLNQIYIVCVS